MPQNTCDLRKLLDIVDECLSKGPGKIFLPRISNQRSFLKKFCLLLNNISVEMQAKGLGGKVALGSCQMYDAMVYKFGPSNRHQKYWRSSMQIYRGLKRINERNILQPIKALAEKLEISNFCYRPTRSYIRYLGSLILDRIYRLDKVRLHCSRSANLSMGYVELGHLLTFNLMCIAIASDVVREAMRQIRDLIQIYNQCSDYFMRGSSVFPQKFDESSLHSSHQIVELKNAFDRKKSTLKDIRGIENLLKLNDLAKEQQEGD